MNKKIILLAPHSEMFHLAKSLASHYENVEVRSGLLEQGVQEALERERKGDVEVFIARGGTALLLRQSGIKTPIVEIPVTVYDLIRSVKEAREVSTKIGVVGFSNMIRGIESLAPILGVELKVFYIESEEFIGSVERQTEHKVQHVINEGIGVIIGGVITCTVASRKNVPGVLIKTGKEAILKVVEEAQRVAAVQRAERTKTEQLNAIIECATEGIIATDERGVITVYNPAAEKITGIKAGDVLGRPVKEVFPGMPFEQVLATGEKCLGVLQSFANGAQALTNNVPVMVNNQIWGVISTFQDVTRIQEYEVNIRRKFHTRSHRARYTFSDIIGTSDSIKLVKDTALQFAQVESNLLITGETGTGKELFAQAIHNESKRKEGSFVAVNCAALPEMLLESELFGYEEGAFTGARKGGREGLFTIAEGGTIFLDEVAEIPLSLQTKLLRVLQEREVRPVGSDRVVPIDVRVIAATNKDLRAAVQEGLFRKDLFFRINVLYLSLPPLRERREDIPLIAKYFLDRFNGVLSGNWEITPEALDYLMEYPWPGNVRELRNIIERAILFTGNGKSQVTLTKVKEALEGDKLICPGEPIKGKSEKESICLTGDLKQMERQVVLKVLSLEGNNRTRTAARLGISRTHIWRLLQEEKEAE
ncbi:MAG: sigma 54-interacting transcriptional regulator [bacterium]